MSIDLWTEASYDAEADLRERRFTAARVAIAPLWTFLAAAEHPRDFENRKAVVAERIDAICDSIASGAEFAVLRNEVEAALDRDFSILNEDRLITEAKRRVAVRKKAEAARKTASAYEIAFATEREWFDAFADTIDAAEKSMVNAAKAKIGPTSPGNTRIMWLKNKENGASSVYEVDLTAGKASFKSTMENWNKSGAKKTANDQAPAGGAEAPDQDTETHPSDTPEGGEHVGPKAECPICTQQSGSDSEKTTEQVGQMSSGASKQPMLGTRQIAVWGASPGGSCRRCGRMIATGERVEFNDANGAQTCTPCMNAANSAAADSMMRDYQQTGHTLSSRGRHPFDFGTEASSRRTAVIEDLETRLVMAVTQYDRREEKRSGGRPGFYNMYALPQYLNAVHEAVAKINAGGSVEETLSNSFSGRLLDVVLKAAQGSPSGGVFVRGGEGAKTAAEQADQFECQECGATFRKKIGPRTTEAKCPKCGGYDTLPVEYFGRGFKGAKTASLIDTLNQIVQSKQAQDIDGQSVDMQTANMLVQIHQALNPENQSKFDLIPLPKLVEWGWSRTAPGGGATPPAAPAAPAPAPQQPPAFARRTAAFDAWVQCPRCGHEKKVSVPDDNPEDAGTEFYCPKDGARMVGIMESERKQAMRKGAPFAGYTDFADCVSKNSDKDDPEAYCGSIKHKVEDKKEGRVAACLVCAERIMWAADGHWHHIQSSWKHTAAPNPYMPGEANPFTPDQPDVGVPTDGMDGPAAATTTTPTTSKPRTMPGGAGQMPGAMPGMEPPASPSGGQETVEPPSPPRGNA